MKEELIRKVQLTDKEMPTAWYNIQADLKDLPPYLNPQTLKPVTAEELAPIFPPEIIKQEMSKERYIDILDVSASRCLTVSISAWRPRA